MDEYLVSTNVELHRNDLLRESEQARVAAELREPHAWRHRMGEAFIRLGRRMASQPAQPMAEKPGGPWPGQPVRPMAEKPAGQWTGQPVRPMAEKPAGQGAG